MSTINRKEVERAIQRTQEEIAQLETSLIGHRTYEETGRLTETLAIGKKRLELLKTGLEVFLRNSKYEGS